MHRTFGIETIQLDTFISLVLSGDCNVHVILNYTKRAILIIRIFIMADGTFKINIINQ